MSNKEPLISVIIPVYNVKDYLRKCLDSICNQTYRNLEILVIDDGSTDGSGAVCDDYAAKDLRINVIHKENGGQSSARNRGIAMAKGDYLAFVDSDDWIENEMYEKLYDNIIKYGVDISMCSYIQHYPNRSRAKCDSDQIFIWTGREAIRELIRGKKVTSMVWDKLYKRSLFDEIKFPAGKIFEDAAIVYRLFAKANKVLLLEKPYYHYVTRPGSTMNQNFYNGERNLIAFNVMRDRSYFLYDFDKELWGKSLNIVALKGVQLVERSFLDSANAEAGAKIRDYVCTELSKIDRSHLRPDLRVKTYLVVDHLPLFKKLYQGFRTVFKSKKNFKKK